MLISHYSLFWKTDDTFCYNKIKSQKGESCVLIVLVWKTFYITWKFLISTKFFGVRATNTDSNFSIDLCMTFTRSIQTLDDVIRGFFSVSRKFWLINKPPKIMKSTCSRFDDWFLECSLNEFLNFK